LTCAFVLMLLFFFFQAEDGIRDRNVTGVQTCALPICMVQRTASVVRFIRNTHLGHLSPILTFIGCINHSCPLAYKCVPLVLIDLYSPIKEMSFLFSFK